MSDLDNAVNDALAGKTPPNVWWIIDKAARPDSITPDNRPKPGHRDHEVKPGLVLRFEYNKPTRVPEELALAMLKNPVFVRTDEKGNEIAFKNPPKQISELEAGERLRLTPNETIASLDELNVEALKVRAARLPEGDKVMRLKKEEIITFIVTTMTRMEAEKAAPPERTRSGDDEGFMPQAETEDFFTNDG